ncbi:hypothetical protein Droror1_Dr00006802 [Drosera rotundifolia]
MQTWVVGKWISRWDQNWARAGTHFHQFVVPPISPLRSDCAYGELAAMRLPDDVQGLGCCEVVMRYNVGSTQWKEELSTLAMPVYSGYVTKEKKSAMISNEAGAAAKKNKKIPNRVVRPSTKKRNGFLTKLVMHLKSDSDFLYSVDAVKGNGCADDLGSPVTGVAGSEKGMIERLREYLESDSFLYGPLIDDDRRRRCSVWDRRRHTRRVTRDTLSPEMTSPVKQSALQREQSTGKNQGMKEYKNNVDTLGKQVLHHRKVLKEVVHQRYSLSNPGEGTLDSQLSRLV